MRGREGRWTRCVVTDVIECIFFCIYTPVKGEVGERSYNLQRSYEKIHTNVYSIIAYTAYKYIDQVIFIFLNILVGFFKLSLRNSRRLVDFVGFVDVCENNMVLS